MVTDASFYQDQRRVCGGWAAWVRIDDWPMPIKGFGSFKKTPRNSSEAEVMAALNGLYIAANRGATHILIRSDCMAVEHLVNGRATKDYMVHRWRNALSAPWASGIVQLTSKHVKGHGDRTRHAAAWTNDWCDQKAKQAMRRARKGGRVVKIGEEVN